MDHPIDLDYSEMVFIRLPLQLNSGQFYSCCTTENGYGGSAATFPVNEGTVALPNDLISPLAMDSHSPQ